MATGTLPRWGNGQSAPHLIPDQVTIASNLLDSQVREPLTTFFARALRRLPAERFDTAAEMRNAWHAAFSEARFTDSHVPDPTARTLALNTATPKTPILSLNLSSRAQNVLERENINTVGDLAATQPARFHHLRGVGDKTARRSSSSSPTSSPAFPIPSSRPNPSPPPRPTKTSLWFIPSTKSSPNFSPPKPPGSAPTVLAPLLDLDDLAVLRPPDWPSQSDIAAQRKVTRAIPVRAGDQCSEAPMHSVQRSESV